jgi:hypothetical protein
MCGKGSKLTGRERIWDINIGDGDVIVSCAGHTRTTSAIASRVPADLVT